MMLRLITVAIRYGCHIALSLVNKGVPVTLYDSANQLFNEVPYSNQCTKCDASIK